MKKRFTDWISWLVTNQPIFSADFSLLSKNCSPPISWSWAKPEILKSFFRFSKNQISGKFLLQLEIWGNLFHKIGEIFFLKLKKGQKIFFKIQISRKLLVPKVKKSGKFFQQNMKKKIWNLLYFVIFWIHNYYQIFVASTDSLFILFIISENPKRKK